MRLVCPPWETRNKEIGTPGQNLTSRKSNWAQNRILGRGQNKDVTNVKVVIGEAVGNAEIAITFIDINYDTICKCGHVLAGIVGLCWLKFCQLLLKLTQAT